MVVFSFNEVDEPRGYYRLRLSQKEKNKYSILMHICRIDEPICKARIETQT